VVLLIVTSIFSYQSWTKNRELQNLLDSQIQINNEIGKSYNQAKVLLVDKDIKITFLDKELKKQVGKVTKVIEKVYIKVKDSSSGGGTAVTSPVTTSSNQTIYQFADYRLSATLNTSNNDFKYLLDQLFDINVYQLKKNDYRVEIIEKNKKTGEIIRFLEAKDFTIIKKIDDGKGLHFGVNLEIGGGGITGLDFHGYPDLYIAFNFMSYGKTHLDSEWRFLTIGSGTRQAIIIPVSWNLGNVIKLFSDAWIDPLLGVSWKGSFISGIGISSTF